MKNTIYIDNDLRNVNDDDWRKNMKVASLWLTDQLEGLTEYGAFSEAWLGEPAVSYLTKKAYLTLRDPNCKWEWKEGTKLSTLIINVMRSQMGHVLRDYIDKNGQPLVKANSEFERPDGDDEFDDANEPVEVSPDDREAGFLVQTAMEKLEALEQEESLRDKGRRIARAAAKQTGDPLLIRYVELVFELPDYRAISKKMRISQDEVKQIEARLIAIFKVKS